MADATDDLYGLDPDAFVAARDALARDLKQSGQLASAAKVAKLRRPTVAAWAVNQAARSAPDAVTELLAAGDALRAAQDGALRGKGAESLRAATERRRQAVDALTAVAAAALAEAGRGAGALGDVTATFEAATVDAGVAEAVRAGRLDRERSAAGAGFGFGEVGDWTPPPATKAATKAAPARPKVDVEGAVREAAARAADLHDAEETVRRLKAELAEANRTVKEARGRANRAELHAEQLRQQAWEAGERDRKC